MERNKSINWKGTQFNQDISITHRGKYNYWPQWYNNGFNSHFSQIGLLLSSTIEEKISKFTDYLMSSDKSFPDKSFKSGDSKLNSEKLGLRLRIRVRVSHRPW